VKQRVINIALLCIRIDEAKYLLEKLLSMTVNQCCLATQKDGVIKEMENRMNQVGIRREGRKWRQRVSFSFIFPGPQAKHFAPAALAAHDRATRSGHLRPDAGQRARR